MENCVFWDVKPLGCSKSRRFTGTQSFHHQADKNRWSRNNVSRNQQPTHSTRKMMEGLSSSETSVLTRATRRNIPKDGILHSHRRENHSILPLLSNPTWFTFP
jgi:hypothetical protein